MRYKLYIEYEGTQYSGWQKQPNASTIEEALENAFGQILQEPIDIIGQGRTDSGVHAEAQIAHVDIKQSVDVDNLLYALLGVLPRDISVWKMEEVNAEFHARFDAGSRQYRYQIVTRPSPLWHNFATFVPYELNLTAMRQCTRMIEGNHNFENFSKVDKDQDDAVCEVLRSEFMQREHLIIYRVKANRFVRHMVRRLVGTMLQVGRGKQTVAQFSDLLQHPSDRKTSHGIAAKGLILENVGY